MYLALPADDSAMIIHSACGDGASILELGSGPGRTTRVLAALGHEVTAVDDSPEMLAHVTGAETVCADVFTLDLDERFDVVVAASHLINRPGADNREALLGVCRAHVAPGGIVLMERHPPGWLAGAGRSSTKMGAVAVTLMPGQVHGVRRSATVRYRLAEREWIQAFDAEDVTDAILDREARQAGLVVQAPIEDTGSWVALRPT